eukprot:7065295-Pyramimonas_sp.AAC.1
MVSQSLHRLVYGIRAIRSPRIAATLRSCAHILGRRVCPHRTAAPNRSPCRQEVMTSVQGIYLADAGSAPAVSAVSADGQ